MKEVLIRNCFPHFDDQLIQELSDCGQLRLYKKNEIIDRINEVLPGSRIILSGCVKVYREKPDISNLEFLITFLSAGKAYGMSLVAGENANAHLGLVTFKASEPTHILTVTFHDKDQLAIRFSQWYAYILHTAVQFYESYLTLIDRIAFHSLEDRLDFFLAQLKDAQQTNSLKITHQEIASSLNASRETISRLLKRKEASNQLKIGFNVIEILTP